MTDSPPIDPGRRRFLAGLAVLWGGTALGLAVPFGRYFAAPLAAAPTTEPAATAEINLAALQVDKAWQPVTLHFAVREGWHRPDPRPLPAFIRDKGGAYEVLSSVCPHLQCNVNWSAEENNFICPCHLGRFDGEGTLLGGPPTEDLSALSFQQVGERLLVNAPPKFGKAQESA